MLFGLLLTLYTINCILLVLVILIQQGKGGMGIGSFGGNTQLLFGGSGGQDLFQKITWVLGAIYMFGSLGLAIMRTQQFQTSTYIREQFPMEQHNPIQQLPTSIDNQAE